MENKKILLIEDDRDILRANRLALELSGYHVFAAENMADGKRFEQDLNPDLIILDILLPDGNGFALCRELRSAGGVRILVLSALNSPADIIEGLRAGADDYLAKPFLTEELLLRVKALLRRGTADPDPQEIGPLEWRPSSLQVFADGEDLQLSPKEYALLELFCRNRDDYLSTEQIYRAVWNSDPGDSVSTVHNHIYWLREKLKSHGVQIEHIRGRGYRILF